MSVRYTEITVSIYGFLYVKMAKCVPLPIIMIVSVLIIIKTIYMGIGCMSTLCLKLTMSFLNPKYLFVRLLREKTVTKVIEKGD